MPLFFIISGLFWHSSPWKTSLRKGVKHLVIPAYCILLLDACLRIASCWLFGAQTPSMKEWINGLLLRGGVLWNSPVWFLLTLFACQIISNVNFKASAVFATVCIAFCTAGVNEFLPSWWFFSVLMAYPFFFAGVLISKMSLLEHISEMPKYSLVIICIAWLSAAICNGYVDINIQCDGQSYLLFLLTGVLGTVITLNLSRVFEKGLMGAKSLNCLGRNSLMILLSHYYICRGAIPLLLNNISWHGVFGVELLISVLVGAVYLLVLRYISSMKKLIKETE